MDVKRQSTRAAIKEAGLSTDIAYEMLRTTGKFKLNVLFFISFQSH